MQAIGYDLGRLVVEEIEGLKKKVENLKSLIQSNLVDYLNNIISYI